MLNSLTIQLFLMQKIHEISFSQNRLQSHFYLSFGCYHFLDYECLIVGCPIGITPSPVAVAASGIGSDDDPKALRL